MFNIKWDKENNGVLLTEEKSSLKPPRPVFSNELNLLEFDKHYDYDKDSTAPLCWCINRKYYYKGKHFATAKGGDLFNKPKPRIFKDGLEFEPMDMDLIISNNNDKLTEIENKSKDFIRDAVNKYSNYPIGVGYSGGKDSQVLLDLVNSTIDDFIVVFSDTTLEHKYTYNNVEKTMEMYNDLDFNIVKPKYTAIELFDLMGLPSRIRRWCTQILKTAPFNSYIDKVTKHDSEKILIIEGVRRDESRVRAKYDYISADIANLKIIKVRPILDWNITEIFLHIYKNKLLLNELYKFGIRRVGCEICPNASGWNEGILGNMNNDYINKYGKFIKKYAIDRGLKTEQEIYDAMAKGYWKKRAGGRYGDYSSEAIFTKENGAFISTLINPQKDPIEYLNLIGEVQNNTLLLDDKEFEFNIEKDDDNTIVVVFNSVNRNMVKMVRKAFKKATYCIDCGMCDSLCSKPKCDRCGTCLNFTYHACLRASSLYKTKEKT